MAGYIGATVEKIKDWPINLSEPGAKAFANRLEIDGGMQKADAEYLADRFIWIISKPSHFTTLGYLLAKPERQKDLMFYFINNSEYGYDVLNPLGKATSKAANIAGIAMSLRDRLVDEKYPAGKKIAMEYDKSLALAFEFAESVENERGGFAKFLGKSEKAKEEKIRLFLGSDCTDERLGKFLKVIERTAKIRSAMRQFEANLKQAFGAKEGKRIVKKIFTDIEGTTNSQWQDSAGRTLWSPLALDWVARLIHEQRELNVKNHHYTYETSPTKESIFERLIEAKDIDQWHSMKSVLYNYDGKTSTKTTRDERSVVYEISYKPGKSYTEENLKKLFEALNSMKESTIAVRKAQEVLNAYSEIMKGSDDKRYTDIINSAIAAKKAKQAGVQNAMANPDARLILK
ncbi:MAG: hypothetical protein WC506_01320 [Candidatus Micrarchaeia archaeon]